MRIKYIVFKNYKKYILFLLISFLFLTLIPTNFVLGVKVGKDYTAGQADGAYFAVSSSTAIDFEKTPPDSKIIYYVDGTSRDISTMRGGSLANARELVASINNSIGDFQGDIDKNWGKSVVTVDAKTGEPMMALNPDSFARIINECDYLSPEVKEGYLEFINTLKRDANGNIRDDHLSFSALEKFLKEKYGNDPEKLKQALAAVAKAKPPQKPVPPSRAYNGSRNCKRHYERICDGPCCPQNYPPGPWEPLPQYDQGRTIVGLHSTKMAVSPVVPVNFGILAPQDQKAWRETHEYQETAITMLPFGVYSTALANSGILDALRKDDEAEANAVWNSISKDIQTEGREAAYDFYGNDAARSLMRKSNLIADTLENLSKATPNFNNSFVYLSENNKVGFARGGVFTTTRYVRKMETTF